MKLEDLSSEYEKVRVITYNVSGDRQVYHNRMIRPVCGTAYVGEPKMDCCGNIDYAVYVRFPGVDVALYTGTMNQWRTDDDIAEWYEREGLGSKECYIERLEKRIRAGNHIRLTEIEFLKYIAPEMETAAWSSREEHAKRHAEKEAARRAKNEAEDAVWVAEQNKRAEDIISAGIDVLKNGGILKNESVTFYESRYSYHACALVNYLFDLYGIKLPIRTRGFIANSVKSVTIKDGFCSTYQYMRPVKSRSNGSSAIWDLLHELVEVANTECVDD